MKSVDAIAKKSVFFRTDVKRAISKIRCGVAFARGVQDLASCHVQVRRASHAESDKKNKVARSRRPGPLILLTGPSVCVCVCVAHSQKYAPYFETTPWDDIEEEKFGSNKSSECSVGGLILRIKRI